jgi:hypothetical protein
LCLLASLHSNYWPAPGPYAPLLASIGAVLVTKALRAY